MKQLQIPFQNLLKCAKIYWVTGLVFGFYLLTIPQFVRLLTPCLQRLPGVSYPSNSCLITLVLDRFMLLALAGFAISLLFLFLVAKPRSFKLLVLTASLLAGLIIVGYLSYIPVSEREIKRAPILLDSFKQ